MKTFIGIIIIAMAGLWFLGCDKDNTPPDEPELVYDPTPYNLKYPEWFPIMDIPSDNPMTVEGVKLGRMLYYDPVLHRDSVQACAECHIQANSFSTPACIPHLNFGWSTVFLWNGKVQGSLEDIMLFEVKDFFQTDLDRLQNHEDYPKLFFEAFGTGTIAHELAAKALSQFERALISANSKYDQAITPSSQIHLTDEEFNGFEIFNTEKGDCFHCHGGILFKDNQLHNNGLDAQPAAGYSEITGDPRDVGKYKTPTLRNIELTKPYMHDGRFETLEEVVDFYSKDLQFSETIDPLMKNVHVGGVHLTEGEKSDLIAFLKTLTDTTFINNQAFSNPF